MPPIYSTCTHKTESIPCRPRQAVARSTYSANQPNKQTILYQPGAMLCMTACAPSYPQSTDEERPNDRDQAAPDKHLLQTSCAPRPPTHTLPRAGRTHLHDGLHVDRRLPIDQPAPPPPHPHCPCILSTSFIRVPALAHPAMPKKSLERSTPPITAGADARVPCASAASRSSERSRRRTPALPETWFVSDQHHIAAEVVEPRPHAIQACVQRHS